MTILRISLQILLFFRLRDEEISKYLMYIMKKISTLESSYMDIKLVDLQVRYTEFIKNSYQFNTAQ